MDKGIYVYHVYWDSERYYYQWKLIGYWQHKDVGTFKVCVWSNEDRRLHRALDCQQTED